jgi:hypothetical protein
MLPIGKLHAIAAAEEDSPLLTHDASKLNENNLYASTSLETGTGKIKKLQITYLLLQQSSEDKGGTCHHQQLYGRADASV